MCARHKKYSARRIGGREFMKTHSGAKKRFRVKPGGKVKRKKSGLRHLNSHMSSKPKRQLGKAGYVDDANMLQIKRQFGF